MLRSETAASPARRARALVGLNAYQQAERGPERTLKPAVAQAGRAVLRDYGTGHGRPVIFVPSLINSPFILDLEPGNSLLEWLAGEGFRPLLVDWGTPEAEARDQGINHHVERMLLPLIDSLGEPPILVGYCLGGTLALGAAAARPVPAVATLAAPWRFARYGKEARTAIAAQWNAAHGACEALGLVPMEVLQAGFWGLDPARTIAKFEKFSLLDPGSAAARGFITLEDWANSGAPLTYAAGRDLFEHFVASDRPGRGRWWVDGKRVVPRHLPCPAVEFVSANDRIVPATSAIGLSDRRTLQLGHVGMVVGSRARAALWEPLRDWLRSVE